MACPICFNNLPLHSAKLCKHSACLPCLKHWYEACERTGQAAPTCPTCRIPVDQEETRLVLGRQFEPAGRQKDAPGEEAVDEFTQLWLSENGAKACRLCGAWLVKDEGCDLMQCICGYRFCWNCETPGAECDCTPSNHVFWDNILQQNAYRYVNRVAAAEELQDLRTFIAAHAACVRQLKRQHDQQQGQLYLVTIRFLKRGLVNQAKLVYHTAIQCHGGTPNWADTLKPFVSSMSKKDVETLFPGVSLDEAP